MSVAKRRSWLLVPMSKAALIAQARPGAAPMWWYSTSSNWWLQASV